MPLAFRVWLCSLALSLSFNSPILTLPRPPASTLGLSQASDEEAVRALTEQYGQAMAVGDLETLRQLWDQQSPSLADRINYYRRRFAAFRTEIVSLRVTRLEITGRRAVSHLSTDERHVDKKTGATLTERDIYHGHCYSLAWIETSSGWKVERESLVQEELAARLEVAASEPERRELLEKESAFVTEVLASLLNSSGYRHRVHGDFNAALRCYQLAQTVAEKIGDQVGLAGSWINLGGLKQAQSDYEQALLCYQKGLALYQAAGIKRGAALTEEKLSHFYRELGNYRQAFECAQKSLRLYQEANYQKGIAEALDELAIVYSIQNNSSQALAHLERAMKIFEELGDKLQIAISRNEMAREHLALGHDERALELYQEILKQTAGYGDRAGAAVIRDEIGSIYAAQGRYAEALDYHRQALSVLEAAGTKREVAGTLINLSDTYLADGKYAEALPFAERAVSLARQTGLPLSLWSALTSLGSCQLALNHPMEARQAFAEAVSTIEKLRAQTVGGVEERERYFESRLRAHHGLLGLLVEENRPPEALALAERTKARVLLDVLQEGRVSIERAMTSQEREQEHRLKSELTLLNRQLTRATQSDKPDPQRLGEIKPRLERARLAYEDFQTSLYAAHPELKTHRGEAPIITVPELASLLPDAASALLEYVVTDAQTYLFAITKAAGKAEAEVRLYPLPVKRAELAKQIEAFRQQLAERDLGFRASALKLSELLLKPAQAQLKGKTNLVIVPDDKLWDLPFQALVTSAHRFLIEDAALAYAPSLTVLREMTKRRRQQHADPASATLLALGNPAIGQATVERATLALRDEKLTPLPEAEQEVRALGQLYGSLHSKVYTGAQAREDRVKAEAGRADILHFATHGILNNASPMYSHLVLAQGDTNEDGLLEAWELMQMDLKAELAVLSACETARGRFGAGEGMIGLTWALFVAGVPSTVVSQWQVESASTRDLMLNFHRQLRAPSAVKATKAEALRQAALKLMKNPATSHPFYWAGFVLVGDGL